MLTPRAHVRTDNDYMGCSDVASVYIVCGLFVTPPLRRGNGNRGAWSRDVWTSHGERSDYDFFNGTSAAAAVIAGLALIIQQRAKERLGRPLTPVEMRALFRDPTCGTEVEPTDPSHSISMPDTMKLFKRIEKIPR